MSDITDKLLIGVTTLELLGLEVDPLTGRLVPVDLRKSIEALGLGEPFLL